VLKDLLDDSYRTHPRAARSGPEDARRLKVAVGLGKRMLRDLQWPEQLVEKSLANALRIELGGGTWSPSDDLMVDRRKAELGAARTESPSSSEQPTPRRTPDSEVTAEIVAPRPAPSLLEDDSQAMTRPLDLRAASSPVLSTLESEANVGAKRGASLRDADTQQDPEVVSDPVAEAPPRSRLVGERGESPGLRGASGLPKLGDEDDDGDATRLSGTMVKRMRAYLERKRLRPETAPEPPDPVAGRTPLAHAGAALRSIAPVFKRMTVLELVLASFILGILVTLLAVVTVLKLTR
jgi:hypothetical protein